MNDQELKELFTKAMTEMGKRSAVAQKRKYGDDYSKEMQRRSKTRLAKKVERQEREKEQNNVQPN